MYIVKKRDLFEKNFELLFMSECVIDALNVFDYYKDLSFSDEVGFFVYLFLDDELIKSV